MVPIKETYPEFRLRVSKSNIQLVHCQLILGGLTPQEKATLINSISPQQTYGTLSLGGNIGFNESILNKASFQYHHFRMLQELLKPILCKANGNI
jgi:hypothetical protein